MVKTTRVACLATVVGLALGSCPFGASSPARAATSSDEPAAIVVWPKIVVDTQGKFTGGEVRTDTVVQLSNVDTVNAKEAHCFYINGNSHCANNPALVCESASDCPSGTSGFAACVPGWSEVDFDIIITSEQPLAWNASEGLQRGDFPLEARTCHSGIATGHPCNSDADCAGIAGSCLPLQTNIGSGIPPVPEDPFVGELKCIQYALTNPPVPDQTAGSNKLKGEATIESVVAGPSQPIGLVDVAKYNAVGLKFDAAEAGVPPNELHMDGVQYEACPTTLLLNFFFESADLIFPNTGDLTLVPCGDDFLDQIPGKVTAQFLVFNEFEQRFSTSRLVDCFFESRLGNIDTPNADRSIFSFNVAGTIAGQARIRGVGNAPTGRGLLGVGRLFVEDFASTAYDLYGDGTPDFTKTQADIITLP